MRFWKNRYLAEESIETVFHTQEYFPDDFIESGNQSHEESLPYSVSIAQIWLVACCAAFIVGYPLMIVGIEVGRWSLLVCVLLSVIGFLILTRLDQRRIALSAVFLAVIGFFVSIILVGMLEGRVWDISKLGRGFYSDGMIALANGYNPLYDNMSNFGKWAYYLPKSISYLEAMCYDFLGHFEMAKIQTFLFAVPTFLLARAMVKIVLPEQSRFASLVAGILVMNPIAVTQFFSFDSDAVLAYAVQCFLLLLFFVIYTGYLSIDFLLCLGMIWIFILHLPCGGFWSACILLLGFVGVIGWCFKWRGLKWMAPWLLLTVGLGFLFYGYDPFVRNLMSGHSWLYAEQLRVSAELADEIPPEVNDLPKLRQLFISMLSNPSAPQQIDVGILAQFKAMLSPDIARAEAYLRGFGIVSPLIFMFALLNIVISLPFLGVSKPSMQEAIDVDGELSYETSSASHFLKTILVGMIMILAIASTSPTWWWARTMAILWTLVPLSLLCLYAVHSKRKRLCQLMIALVLINTVHLGCFAVTTTLHETQWQKAYMSRIQQEKLPSEEDAKLYNFYIEHYPAWVKLKLQKPMAMSSAQDR